MKRLGKVGIFHFEEDEKRIFEIKPSLIKDEAVKEEKEHKSSDESFAKISNEQKTPQPK